VFLYDEPDVVQKILDATGGKGVAAAYDGVGVATWDITRAVLGYAADFITFGNASGKVRVHALVDGRHAQLSARSTFAEVMTGLTRAEKLPAHQTS
jgi:NADPH2:quinone reductase